MISLASYFLSVKIWDLVVVAVVTVAVIRANTYVSETVLCVLHIYIHLFLLQSHEVNFYVLYLEMRVRPREIYEIAEQGMNSGSLLPESKLLKPFLWVVKGHRDGRLESLEPKVTLYNMSWKQDPSPALWLQSPCSASNGITGLRRIVFFKSRKVVSNVYN